MEFRRWRKLYWEHESKAKRNDSVVFGTTGPRKSRIFRRNDFTVRKVRPGHRPLDIHLPNAVNSHITRPWENPNITPVQRGGIMPEQVPDYMRPTIDFDPWRATHNPPM